MKGSTKYLAFLLRLWRGDDKKAWRATLQNPHTGERRSFADLPTLLAFLEEQTGEQWDVCSDEFDVPEGGEDRFRP